jgi:excisionase family DNA binding protein
MIQTQPKPDMGSRVLTVRELAGYLRVHQTTVYRLLREQKLPAFRVGATGVSTAKRSSGG